MIIVYGTRLYGRIDRCGSTFLATRFFHVWYLPLIPLGSQLVVETVEGGTYRFLSQPLSGRSLLAALLRTWGVLAVIGLVIATLGGFTEALAVHDLGGLVGMPLASVVALTAVAAAFVRLGRLSEAQRAEQHVYADFIGYPIDVARFRERREDARHLVTQRLEERAQTLGLLGYRNDGAAGVDHIALALDPAVTDLEYLRAALTLARIEWAEVKGEAKKKRAADHAAIAGRIEERTRADERLAEARAAAAAIDSAGSPQATA